jgi:hypothetical protein
VSSVTCEKTRHPPTWKICDPICHRGQHGARMRFCGYDGLRHPLKQRTSTGGGRRLPVTRLPPGKVRRGPPIAATRPPPHLLSRRKPTEPLDAAGGEKMRRRDKPSGAGWGRLPLSHHRAGRGAAGPGPRATCSLEPQEEKRGLGKGRNRPDPLPPGPGSATAGAGMRCRRGYRVQVGTGGASAGFETRKGARKKKKEHEAMSDRRSVYAYMYPSFTHFSTKFFPLYLISLQQHSLNLVLYILNPILETYFVPNFYTYVFIIPQMLWKYFIFI